MQERIIQYLKLFLKMILKRKWGFLKKFITDTNETITARKV